MTDSQKIIGSKTFSRLIWVDSFLFISKHPPFYKEVFIFRFEVAELLSDYIFLKPDLLFIEIHSAFELLTFKTRQNEPTPRKNK